MTPRAAAGLALAAALGAASAAQAEVTPGDAAPVAAPPTAIVDQPALFTSDDLMLLVVTSGDEVLSDGLDTYSSRAGVFVPLGALSRLLDISVVVDPAKRRADGWVGSPDRRVRLDLASRQATVAGETFSVSNTDVAFYQDEIFVSLGLLEKLLPLKVKVDLAGLAMSVKPMIALPFQERLERQRRRDRLTTDQNGEGPAALRIATPYEVFTRPAIDLNLQAQAGNDTPSITGRYEVRAAGDLLWAGMQFVASSDDQGELSDMRILLERKDPDGKIAGPYGATRSGLGDTYTPGLSVGARSVAGRGFAITSAPLEQAAVFERIDLRGELPIGYQAELYVNEVLRASQGTPVQGRYEFPNVSLAYGLNVIRIVFYGPRGERREEIRRINFNGGALRKGQFVYSLGAVEEARTVFGVSESGIDVAPGALPPTPGFGKTRIVGSIGYGLFEATTLTAGFAQYTPRPDDTRRMAALGVVTSLDRMSLQFDVARDDSDGAALGFGVAGRIHGVSVVARHAEYSGGFVDEARAASVDPTVDVVRSSEAFIDLVQRIGAGSLPLSVRLARDELSTGERRLVASLRASTAVNRYLLSSSLDYQSVSGGGANATDRLDGAAEVSGLVSAEWQVRGGVTYPIYPKLKVSTAYLTADRQIQQRSALHLAVNHSFDGDQTGFQVAQTWRLSAADISLNGSYTTGTNDVRVGIQFSFGLTPDPYSGRYRAIGPGATAGGAVAVQAFVDANADGVAQSSERGLPDVVLMGGRRGAATDARGVAIVAGLGDSASAQVIVDPNSIEDPYLLTPPRVITLTPRPGRVAKAPYPLTTQGEVELHVLFHRTGQARRGLSALQVQLLDAQDAVVADGRTEFDGTLVLERLRPGAYRLRLDPEQSARLGLRLAAPVEVAIPDGGGFVGQKTVTVVRADEPAATPQAGD